MIEERFQWRLKNLYSLYIYIGLIIIGLNYLPNNIWDATHNRIIIIMGVIGTWRYSWWFLHLGRSLIYALVVFPQRKRRAKRLWEKGWRPKAIYFMITSYNERKEIIESCVNSILDECRACGVPAKLYVGSAMQETEDMIISLVEDYPYEIKFDVKIVRQAQPGKRCAIGTALRAMAREDVSKNDPVVFMDGDSILAPGCLRKCVPFFPLFPKMHALTTCEQIIMIGPQWMRSLLELRFAQRHMMMQSYALSNKVLCLTGRMSVFRVRNVIKEEFIHTIEADHLYHWLWGNFRFLSGDDKSSWYYLLSQGYDLHYIADALVYTIDEFDKKPFARLRADMMRWSGNILRNGTRAMMLGPKRLNPFIWWCIVDQRIAMWTMLVAPVGAIALSIIVDPKFFMIYVVWVLFTRLILSTFIWGYLGRIDMTFPFILYFLQLSNSLIKIYISFRLSQQSWFHRGNQKSGGGVKYARLKKNMATYLTLFFFTLFCYAVMLYFKLLPPPF
ncbi:MAG: glycosyltransferase family 2 protein [Gammaproteobacteria bacterium]|nr:glycosyltransferase family 2 protein [Gammaproteobacteria bacterium]